MCEELKLVPSMQIDNPVAPNIILNAWALKFRRNIIQVQVFPAVILFLFMKMCRTLFKQVGIISRFYKEQPLG